MASQEDIAFAKVCLELGITTKADLAKALFVVRKYEKYDFPKGLDRILLKLKILSKSQIRQVYRTLKVVGCPYKTTKYDIKAKIGQGGMGSVYYAIHREMERPVALKVLLPAFAKDEQFVKLFLNEAQNAAKLSHVNIVMAHDVGHENGIYFFAMEYIDGETVAEVLDRNPNHYTEEEVLNVGLQMAKAVEHVHKKGLIHRDIKPDNIMVAPNGIYKLADLGLTVASGSMKGVMSMGTPSYMSPEQVLGTAALDGRCDIYSLGAALYHMASGVKPFVGKNAQEVSRMQIMFKPKAPCAINPNRKICNADNISKTTVTSIN